MMPVGVSRAMAVIAQGRLLVGLFVAGWLALHLTPVHAQAGASFTMTANPPSAQLIYPTNSTQTVITANLPVSWQGDTWSTTTPQYGTLVLGEDCSPASATCTVTYTQQATPTFGSADPFVVTLTGLANGVAASGSV